MYYLNKKNSDQVNFLHIHKDSKLSLYMLVIIIIIANNNIFLVFVIMGVFSLDFANEIK